MKISKKIKLCSTTILLIAFAITCLVIVLPSNHILAQKNIEYTNTTKINLKSWLSNINNEVLINTINIPGSHDSAASNVALSYKSQCQNYTIYNQLNFGIRYLDVRLSDKDSNIFLCHGPITCYKNNGSKYLYKDLLNECSKFLNENPSEFIIINVKNEQMSSNIQNFNKKVDDETLTIVNAQNLYISDEIPKLKVVRGKIILNKRFSIDDTVVGHLNWINQPHPKIDESLYEKSESKQLIAFSQDQFKLSKKDKKIAITTFINKSILPENGYRLCFFSNSGNFFASPKNFINSFEYNQNNFAVLKRRKGFILIYDFCNEEKTNYLILTNF